MFLLESPHSLNIFYSTISYIYTQTIYMINRIRTEASAYLVLLLMDTVALIMAAQFVCYKSDSNEYTQYTIFNIKKKISLNHPISSAM